MTEKKLYYQEIYKTLKRQDREAFRDLFLKLHEQDQVEVFHLLYPENKTKITYMLTAQEFAELFERLDYDDQWEAVQYLPKGFLQEVFTYVADDEVARFIRQIDDPDLSQETLAGMKAVDRQAIEKILTHQVDSAGSIMTTELVTVSEEATVEEAIQTLRQIGRQAETIYYIYVIDAQERLAGVLSIRDLLFAKPDAKMKDISNSQIVAVDVETDQEEVARLIKDYDLLALPVTDSYHHLLGIVTVDDIMDVIDEEATEDFHRFAGISVSDEEGDEPDTIIGMTRSRLPWILILIFMGMISANLIGMFEETLSKVVALAAFMPIIMDSAGNVGTQSLAVSVRRITLGNADDVSFWKMLWNEFCSGFLIGLASCLTIGLIAYFLYGNWVLSFIIGASLLVTLSISTVIGYVVPALFNKIGIDPAVASGPFITTINDACGLMIYFSLATYLLHHLQ
ncbi:magnesium transporter [Hutsoniella sourekii]